jgi:hypothetical protein
MPIFTFLTVWPACQQAYVAAKMAEHASLRAPFTCDSIVYPAIPKPSKVYLPLLHAAPLYGYELQYTVDTRYICSKLSGAEL